MADINAAISAIPDAVDGQPIGSNFHNSMKAAIALIAQGLGVSGPPQTIVTLTPTFQQNGSLGTGAAAAAWLVDSTGLASKQAASATADGWFDVQFPNGVSIDRVTVIGRKNSLATTAPVFWSAQLFRQPVTIGAGAALPLFTADLDAAAADGSGNFREDALLGNPQGRIVDNVNFKYIVVSKLQNANPAGEARISAIQVIYSR